MILSHIKIIGSLVYRTRRALRDNKDFLKGIDVYAFADNCFLNDELNLWHYPGTHNEISSVLRVIENPEFKFPALLNFQPVKQTISENETVVYYNLAFVAPVLKNWTTEQREEQVFDKVLRTIYAEFMRQISKCGYFVPFIGMPSHSMYEIFTTGKSSAQVMSTYGDHLDAIEIHNLKLTLNTSECNSRVQKIDEENYLVTKNLT